MEASCPVFINADLIAAGLSPFQPETAAFRAARLMWEDIARHAAERRGFAFETTLSGLTYARMIAEWRAAGFTVCIANAWITGSGSTTVAIPRY